MWGTAVLCTSGCAIRRMFNGNNFATSSALAEICALPSSVLVAEIGDDR